MSLSELSFIGIYFPLLLIAYYNPLLRSNRFRRFLLLCASLGLYAFACPFSSTVLLCLSILGNFLLVRLSDRSGRHCFRSAAILLDAAVLLFCKYHSMLSGGRLSFALPTGLSYYMFKLISYVSDSEKTEESGSLADAVLYAANFLTVVSGPLTTYEDELSMLREKKRVTSETARSGFERIIVGLAGKYLIADSLGILADRCFASDGLSAVMSWAGAAAYTLQLYFDFAGYTSIVLGVGALFGFDLPENFRDPYVAESVSDFWNRWHISLTRWLTRYVYIPLGGSRVDSKARHLFNLFAVWLVSGAWHGSRATFLVWAFVYFVLQAVEKYTGLTEWLKRHRLARLYTLTVIVLEWVIFRSETLSGAFTYMKGMFGLSGNPFCAPGELETLSRYSIPFVLGILFSTPAGRKLKDAAARSAGFRCLYDLGLLALLCVCLAVLISMGYSAPLYAVF